MATVPPLVARRSRSGPRPARRLKLTGLKFGRLTVLEEAPAQGKFMMWLCRCDCGKTVVVRANNLRTNNTRGCGCERPAPNKLPPGQSAANSLFSSRYKCGARNRKIGWGLTKEQFMGMVTQNCHYCGLPPSARIVNGSSVFVFTGIDRVDSSKGYIDGNCVPCCKACNFAKNEMSVEAFRSFIHRVFSHMFGAPQC